MIVRSLISMAGANQPYPLSYRYDAIGNNAKIVSLKRYAGLGKREKLLALHCKRYRSFSDRGKSYMFIKINCCRLNRISTQNNNSLSSYDIC